MTVQRLMAHAFVSLLLVQALVPAARAGGQDTPPPAVPDAPGASAAPVTAPPTVWLRGPFGRVAGGSVDDPATAPPGDQPLGTVVRGAPLVLEIDGGAAITALIVTALPRGAPGADEPLSDGALTFEGPDGVGSHLVVADVTIGHGVASQHAWVVDVPDRPAPLDGLYDIPAPDIVVGSSAGSTAGQSGSGCYAYLCVDVGNPPPAETLPVLEAKVGDLLTAQAADGSAIVAWDGRLTPVDEPALDTVRSEAALTEPLAGVVSLKGLEPPMPGRWRLDLEVEFDRERGWMRTFYLLDVT